MSEHYVLVKEPRTTDFEFNLNEVQTELQISVRFSVLGLRVGLSNVSPCSYSTLLPQLLSSAGQERPWEIVICTFFTFVGTGTPSSRVRSAVA